MADAVQWAEEHLFDRNSVVLECQLWQEALGRARGETFSVLELTDFTRRRGYIRDEARPGEVTLRDVLLREWEIVQSAKEGVAACHPLVANPRLVNPKLDDEQRKALDALLCSTNAVSLFRGGAGTGKSFVLREVVEQVQQAGRRVVVLAPQRQQVVDMEKAGLPSPSTVANFLLKRELLAGAVVVVDEAGQIGTRSIAGTMTGSSMDAEDTLSFSALQGVRPMIETMPLANAAEAYGRMMRNEARFRIVLVTGR